MVENKHLKDNPYRIEVSYKVLEKYLIPTISQDEQSKILNEFEKDQERRFKKILFIARMQPLHFGHLLAMKMGLRIADELAIGIGSSNVINEDNPWTSKERKRMVEKALEQNRDIASKLNGIIYLPDTFTRRGEYDDPKWVSETIRRARGTEAVMSNNDWVVRLLNPEFAVIRPPFFDRDHFQGTKIREKLRNLYH